jgi:hypothetical protein
MEVEVCPILLIASAFIIWSETWRFSNYALMLRSGVLPSPRNPGPMFPAVRGCQQQPKNTVAVAPARLHSLIIIRKFDLMKRKHLGWDSQSPRDSARQNCLECPCSSPSHTPRYPSRSAPYLLLIANNVLNVALVLLPRPLLRESVVRSLNPPTSPKRLHRSTSRPLQNQSPQTGCFQHDHSHFRLPLTKENLRALEPIVPLAEEASPMSTPPDPSPAWKESARTHEAISRLQHHLRPWHTVSRCACAICESTCGTL